MPSELPPYRRTFQVHSYEADPDGRLTPRSLCLYLQEAAAGDAERLGVSIARLLEANLAWVLQRLKVETRLWPCRGASLDVSTWAWEFERVVARRDFEVREESGALVATATSRWVVVDMTSRRAVRLPDFVRNAPLVRQRAPVEFEKGSPRALESAEIERRFEVRRSDLDVARHVNNTRYVGWALETLPEGLLATHRPAGFEFVFRRESGCGDTILARSRELTGQETRAFSHELRSESARQELAAAVSRWRPLGPADDRA